MDFSIMHAILAVVAIILGVVTRFGVYSVLVKNNRWLPEKATKVANISAISVAILGIVAVVANVCMGGV